MTTPDMNALSGEHEHEQSSESGILPVAHDRFEAAFPMGAGCFKARDIEAVVLSGVYGDPMAQHAWSIVRKACNRILEVAMAASKRILSIADLILRGRASWRGVSKDGHRRTDS